MEFGQNEPHVPELTVVLDLDETLVHTYGSITEDSASMISNVASLDIRNRIYIIDLGFGPKMIGIQRNYVRSFLSFCGRFFKYVIIYSAGSKNYVEAVVKKIFKGIRPPDMILSRNDCITLSDKSIVKSLDIVIGKARDKGILISKSDIVFIDDNPDYIRLDRNNAINIPAYEPSPTIESIRKRDQRLLQILIALAYPDSVDISELVKGEMFNKLIEQEEIELISEAFEPSIY